MRPMAPSQQMAALIRENRDTLLTVWRHKIRHLPRASQLDTPALNDHIPVLLEELAAAFEAGSDDLIDNRMQVGSPLAHGIQRFENGFALKEIVAEYNVLRECIHDIADKHSISMQGSPFHILNRALDRAIGAAVEAFAEQAATEMQRRQKDHLAFIAHDLRTPLNAISLASQMISHSSDLGNRQRALTTLNRNCQYLTTLINQVLEENIYVEADTSVQIERRHLDLWPLVETLVHDMRPVASASNTEITNLVPEDLVIYADAVMLRRIFQNLIANAINYAPNGVIEVSAERASNYVKCNVTDNGSGIAQDRLERIFAKFDTDSPATTNIGLGLTICKTFVEAHGGAISVLSQIGQGSRFIFTLPD
jgi:two-component system phosphate regulon sensor histidine kinase PhoR